MDIKELLPPSTERVELHTNERVNDFLKQLENDM